jgi:hypothetical protein
VENWQVRGDRAVFEGERIICVPEAPDAVRIVAAMNRGLISDGYHTMDELYQHRRVLWVTLCRLVKHFDMGRMVWRSDKHSDGSSFAGWFVLGISAAQGQQMTYHLPVTMWQQCEFAETLDRAPEFDGHTPADVLERLARL